MNKYYKIQITYPNGHTSDLEPIFSAKDKAIEYGNGQLTQIRSTEQFYASKKDELGFSKKIDPYFLVIEFDGEKRNIVFESEHKKRKKLFR